MARKRHPGLLLGAILSAVVLVTGCAVPRVQLPFSAGAVITPQQARSTFLELESERTIAIHGGNRAALAAVETGQALANDAGEMAVMANGVSDDGEGAPFTAVSMIVPLLTGYPAWFAAETRSDLESGLDVAFRRGPRAPWKLQFETVTNGRVPAVARKDGYAVTAALERNLSSDLASYHQNGVLRAPTRFVLPGPYTSGEVQGDLNQISNEQRAGWSYSLSFAPGAFDPSEGLSLARGGSLGFATFTVTWSVSALSETCFMEDPRSSQAWSQLGSRGYVSDLNVTGVASAPVIETRKGDQVIGQDLDEVRVDQQNC